jgi:hypothetical protein
MNAITTVANQPIVYPVTKEALAELAKKYATVPQDLSRKDDYEWVRKACSELRGLRTKVEARRKELKADALEYGRKVDAAAKEITEGIIKIEEPIATAKKEYDTAEEIRKRELAMAEERRIDEINTRISLIKAAVTANISSDSATISAALKEIAEQMPCTWADEFAEKAEAAATETISKLSELLQMKVQQEEAEAIRKAEEEQRAREEEERKAREQQALAAEREKLEEEREKLEEERRALAEKNRLIEEENERLRKEQAEKDAAEQAEKDRLRREIEALKAKAAPAEAPAKVDTEPTKVDAEPAKVDNPATTTPSPTTENYRAAGNAMLEIIGNKQVTKSLLDAIIDGQIPHISFTPHIHFGA